MSRRCERCRARRRVPTQIKPRGRVCAACQYATKLEANARYYRAHRDAIRAQDRERYRRNPAPQRAHTAAWKRAHPERVREIRTENYRQTRTDPRRWAAYLERKRLEQRLRLERAGRPRAPIPTERYPAASKHWRIDPAPIARAVRRWSLATGEGQESIAARAGVSPRLVEAHMLGEREAITVDAADKLALAIGLHLDVLYVDELVIHPKTGEVLDALASAPPEILADFYAAIRVEQARLEAMRRELKAELEARLAIRGVAVMVAGEYEIGVRRGKRSTWDGVELERVVRELIDAGAITYRDVEGLLSHDVAVDGNAANRLSRRLIGRHKAAVEACRTQEPVTRGFDVVASLPLIAD